VRDREREKGEGCGTDERDVIKKIKSFLLGFFFLFTRKWINLKFIVGNKNLHLKRRC
jgi:hypothetical protein